MSSNIKFNPKRIGILGVGLIGGSFGLALKSSDFSGTIVGISSPKTLKKALDLNCIDEAHEFSSLENVIKSLDILILCSPVEAILNILDNIKDMELPKGLIISDVGSTKFQIINKAKKVLPAHVNFIGGHPMTGSEKSGPESGDPYLFQNSTYVICTENKSEIVIQFSNFLKKHLGCNIIFLNAKIHDEIVSTISHVPHLLAIAMMQTAKKVNDYIPQTLQLVAGGFRDVTRIASAPWSMWKDIIATNKEPIKKILENLIFQLNTIKKDLENDNLQKTFEEASIARKNIPENKKGFSGSLYEILVPANDKPGTLLKISQSLASQNINIKDIEVLRIKEGKAGTIKLAFDSKTTGQNAIKILKLNGFLARERV